MQGSLLTIAEAAKRLGVRAATLEKSERAALSKAGDILAGMGFGPELLAVFGGTRRRKQ